MEEERGGEGGPFLTDIFSKAATPPEAPEWNQPVNQIEYLPRLTRTIQVYKSITTLHTATQKKQGGRKGNRKEPSGKERKINRKEK